MRWCAAASCLALSCMDLFIAKASAVVLGTVTVRGEASRVRTTKVRGWPPPPLGFENEEEDEGEGEEEEEEEEAEAEEAVATAPSTRLSAEAVVVAAGAEAATVVPSAGLSG